MRIDALTHILPRYFADERDDVVRRDRTFAGLFGSMPRARIEQAGQLIASMDDAEIDVAIVAGFGWTDLELARRANDYLLESVAKHAKRLIASCSANPLWGDAALDELDRCFRAGATCVGELHADTQGWRERIGTELDDFMALTASKGAVTIVHGSEPFGHTYPGKGTMTPDHLHSLARRYPANRFVFAHFGGGLPWYSMMPEVGSALSNVWYDTAATPYLYQSNVYSTASAAVGADKILFASDWPLISQRRALRHIGSDDRLDAIDFGKIVGKNAADLFGLGDL